MSMTCRVALALAACLVLTGCPREPEPPPEPSAPAPEASAARTVQLTVEERLTTGWTGRGSASIPCPSGPSFVQVPLTKSGTHADNGTDPHWRLNGGGNFKCTNAAQEVTFRGVPREDSGHNLTGFDLQPGTRLFVFERLKSGWRLVGCKPFDCGDDACTAGCTPLGVPLTPTLGEHDETAPQPHWLAIGLGACALAAPDDSAAGHAAPTSAWASRLTQPPAGPLPQEWDFAVVEIAGEMPMLRSTGMMAGDRPGDGWTPLVPTPGPVSPDRWLIIWRECATRPTKLDVAADGTLLGFSAEPPVAPAP